MQELISPEQSEKLVVVGTLLMALIGAGCGYRAIGPRGLLAGVAGLLIFPLWQMHKYLTRFDPVTGYFGLDKVKVLLMEVAIFVVLGLALGWAWSALSRSSNAETNSLDVVAEDAQPGNI